MIKYINKNIIDLAKSGEYDYIVHGCNCFCAMNSGVAKAIVDAFPEARHEDNKTTPGDSSKLGSVTFAKSNGIVVVNCYTQYRYGTDSRKLNYEAMYKCLEELSKLDLKSRILIPKIGCGLAGGNWKIVDVMIHEILGHMDITISVFDKK
jgi:O-acetyl-ADP-ribose deacetylase (regulator of RNase III)